MYLVLVPTCQVRAFRFYQRWFSFLLPSSSFSSGSIGSRNCERQILVGTADLNWELQISVGTARPQPRVSDLSGHCRNSTASARSQWALPGLNDELQISVGTAGPQLRAPDLSAQDHWDLALAVEVRQCPMSEKMSERMPDRTPESMSPYRPERVSAYMPESMSEQMPKNVRAYARKRKNVRVCLGFCFDKRNKVYRDSTKFNNADFGVIEHQIPSAPNQSSQSSLLQLVKPPPLVAETLALINPKLVFWHLHQNLYLDPHVHWLNDQTGYVPAYHAGNWSWLWCCVCFVSTHDFDIIYYREINNFGVVPFISHHLRWKVAVGSL